MKLYFNHSLMENTSRQEADIIFSEIIDLRTFCNKKKIDLRFYEKLWEVKIGNILLYDYIERLKDIKSLLIQAVKSGPFYSTDYDEVSLIIEPSVLPGTFGETILYICFSDKQKEILSLVNEKTLSERTYQVRNIDNFVDILNFKGKNELLSYLNSLLKFRNIEEVFELIERETENIIILYSARRSARKHDFRSFCSVVYFAIMGLEDTELDMILQDKNEIDRKKVFLEKYHLEISRETSTTLKSRSCLKIRSFDVPGQGNQLFEWHIKIDGNRTRIHYWVDKINKKVYIGHCGEHLPTVG